MIRRVSRPLSAKDIGKKSKFDGANSGCKKKFLMQFLIFFCYELSVCPLILKSDKVYFASSLIAKPILDCLTIGLVANKYTKLGKTSEKLILSQGLSYIKIPLCYLHAIF